MNALYDLRDTLCKNLEEYSRKGSLSTSELDTVDKLAHSIKNLDKVIEECDYSNYGGSYRGRRRDSMGRYTHDGYSRHGDVTEKLRRLADEAPDDVTRQEIHRLVAKMETM